MPRGGGSRGALPNLIVIGAMKCATSALHRYLGRHPRISMSEPKELNFFFGPDEAPADVAPATLADWGFAHGNWHRGIEWYRRHFLPGSAVRGESSPGYTSPDHPEAAARLARVVPRARLVYLVRDPIERAVVQYLHHRRDGTESRPLDEALVDPASQYVSRSRYHERLAPFLVHFDRAVIKVVAQEDLARAPRDTLVDLLRFLGVDDDWDGELGRAWKAPATRCVPGAGVREQFTALVRADAARLRRLTGDDFAAWAV